MGLLDADLTEQQHSPRQRTFWALLLLYPLCFLLLVIVAIYFLVSRQTKFDPAIGYDGTLWLAWFTWGALSIFSLCGHIVAILMNCPAIEWLTRRHLIKIMCWESVVMLIVMYLSAVIIGEWAFGLLPLVSGLLVSVMVRVEATSEQKNRAKKRQ